MLEFAENYFEGEERDGFYVEEMMKRAWAVQIDLIDWVAQICKKYGLTYYADGGTLLGAVRHKGFIPWDDDTDISMKRADAMKFLQYAKEELPEGMALHYVQDEEEYSQAHIRLINSTKVSTEKEYLDRWYGFPYVAGLDIFILDDLPTDKEEGDVLQTVLAILVGAYQILYNGDEISDQQWKELEEIIGMPISREGNQETNLVRVIDNLGKAYMGEGGDLAEFCCFAKDATCRLPRKYYEETVLLPFENIMIPAPKYYHEVLTILYGDYMTPIRGTAEHEYPFYRKQEVAVEQWLREHS